MHIEKCEVGQYVNAKKRGMRGMRGMKAMRAIKE